MLTTDSLEKILMLEKNEGRRRWLDSITDSMGMNWSKFQETVKDRGAWCVTLHGVVKSWTWLSNWTKTTKLLIIVFFFLIHITKKRILANIKFIFKYRSHNQNKKTVAQSSELQVPKPFSETSFMSLGKTQNSQGLFLIYKNKKSNFTISETASVTLFLKQ